MPKRSPRELIEVFYPDPVPPGMFALYSVTLENGNEHSHWCHHAAQADRLCQRFRNTRRVCFGAGLQSQDKAPAIAHERRLRARPGSIRGCAASVTALPALWAVIPYGAIPTLPPGRRHALSLLQAVRQPPSIVISTQVPAPRGGPSDGARGVIYAFWLLDRPWLFDVADPAAADRTAAGALLCRVQGAVARLAAEQGLAITGAGAGGAGDLAAAFPLPDFPTGATAGGPRAVREACPLLPGDARYRRRDFESLPAPPVADAQPWRGVMEPPAGAARGRRTLPFPPVADGCSWIRGCRGMAAVELVHQLAGVGAGGGAPDQQPDGVVQLLPAEAGALGYDQVDVDRLLSRALRAPGGPITCAQIGRQPGVVERHCSKCPHFGRIDAPVELAPLRQGGLAGVGPPDLGTPPPRWRGLKDRPRAVLQIADPDAGPGATPGSDWPASTAGARRRSAPTRRCGGRRAPGSAVVGRRQTC